MDQFVQQLRKNSLRSTPGKNADAIGTGGRLSARRKSQICWPPCRILRGREKHMIEFKNIGPILAEIRTRKKMNQQEMALHLNERGINVTNQAISKWEQGSTTPSATQFLAVCDILGIRDVMATFSDGGAGIMKGLNAEGRARAEEYIRMLAHSPEFSVNGSASRENKPTRTLPVYTLLKSAGNGHFLDSNQYEMVSAAEDTPLEANFGVRVFGDSMAPEYVDGQLVWIQQQPSLSLGDVGLFLYDGSVYLKEYRTDGTKIFLRSLNPAYSDIVVASGLDLTILGKAI